MSTPSHPSYSRKCPDCAGDGRGPDLLTTLPHDVEGVGLKGQPITVHRACATCQGQGHLPDPHPHEATVTDHEHDFQDPGFADVEECSSCGITRYDADLGAAQRSSPAVNTWALTPVQQATFDATGCTCTYARQHSTTCAKWRAVIAPSLVPLQTDPPTN